MGAEVDEIPVYVTRIAEDNTATLLSALDGATYRLYNLYQFLHGQKFQEAHTGSFL